VHTASWVEKAEMPLQSEKAFSIIMSTPVSIEAIRVCITIDNNEILLAAVYKSPRHVWIDADIFELLRFTAPVASAYRMSTRKVKLSEINSLKFPGLDRSLKHKQRIQKL
jgi:hypothetical protein